MFRKNAAKFLSTYAKVNYNTEKLSDDIILWTQETRMLKGTPFSFENRDYLLPIYRDTAKEIYIVKGRQTEITEFALNWLLFNLTKNPGTVGLYLSDRDSHTSKFSNLRLKNWAIGQSKILQHLAPLKKHSSTTQSFENGSVLYMHSAWGEFDQARSVPADFTVVDEMQSVNVKEIDVLQEALSHSKFGYMIGIGTGSDEGSDWHKLWQLGNQCCWDVNSKKWIAKNPDSKIHSYHLPQTIVPWMSLQDIEDKRRKMTSRRFETEVIGGWFRGAQKPLIESDIRNLFDRNLSLIIPEKVDKSRGKIYMGVDWGGGQKAFTVPWIWQCLDENIPLFQVLYFSKIEEPSVEKQYAMISKLIEDYDVDQVVMDSGGGPYQVQKLEERFGSRAIKCSYMVRPAEPINDLKLAEENLYVIDRTFAIDSLIDLIKRPHIEENNKLFKIMMPAKDLERIEWIIDHFTSIESESMSLHSGQDYVRYVHDAEEPDDALHACVYAFIPWIINQKSRWFWISG